MKKKKITKARFLDAAENRDIDTVKRFLEEGGNANAQEKGWTAILNAAYSGYEESLEIIRLLLLYGADINSLSGELKMTPLHLAAYHGNYDVAKLLIEEGANVKIEDGDGETALQLAEEELHFSIVELIKNEKSIRLAKIMQSKEESSVIKNSNIF